MTDPDQPPAPPPATNTQARALASPLRLRILRLCLDTPLTNQQIAHRLGLNPATAYHHVKVLEREGFLAPQTERTGRRGAREVPYLATRASWHAPSPTGTNRVLLDTFLAEFAVADPDAASVIRLGIRVGEATRARLRDKVVALFEEIAALPSEPDGTPYSLFYVMHDDVQRAGLDDPVTPEGRTGGEGASVSRRSLPNG